jgi:hypothetical protein
MADRDDEALIKVLVRRALAQGDATRLHLHFDAAVVQRYRETNGFSVIRTNPVGRIKKQGGWSLDVGIAPGESVIHAVFADLLHLPEAEREHWAEHAVDVPGSATFISMRMTPSACFDDGELRAWE